MDTSKYKFGGKKAAELETQRLNRRQEPFAHKCSSLLIRKSRARDKNEFTIIFSFDRIKKVKLAISNITFSIWSAKRSGIYRTGKYSAAQLVTRKYNLFLLTYLTSRIDYLDDIGGNTC